MEIKGNMKTRSIIIAFAATVLSIGNVQARGTFTGTVESVTSSNSVSNVFLSNEITPVNGETIPACATRRDFMTLGADQRNQLAVVLTALALGSEVRINGSDTCQNNGVESIGSIRLLGN